MNDGIFHSRDEAEPADKTEEKGLPLPPVSAAGAFSSAWGEDAEPELDDAFEDFPPEDACDLVPEEPAEAVKDDARGGVAISAEDEQREPPAVASPPHSRSREEKRAAPSGPRQGGKTKARAEGLGTILGVRFKKTGQVFYFPAVGLTVRMGTKVLVQTDQGPSLGEVLSMHEGEYFPFSELTPGSVLGLATAQDIARHAENSILAAEASAFCKTCIRQHSLDMKLVDVEVLHDKAKIVFYFTAPARIDFRELVKDLVRNYRTRIELRQIGVRHETQMVGALGNCGMVCCCHRYLRKFAPVTIKMAKEQNLFLNPAKLSGMCGRLLCCLSFEQSNYEEFNRRCPKLGKKYTTASGMVKVIRANMFSQSLFVLSEGGEEVEYSLEEWENQHPRRAEQQGGERRPAAAPVKEGEESRRKPPRHRPQGPKPRKQDMATALAAMPDPDANGNQPVPAEE